MANGGGGLHNVWMRLWFRCELFKHSFYRWPRQSVKRRRNASGTGHMRLLGQRQDHLAGGAAALAGRAGAAGVGDQAQPSRRGAGYARQGQLPPPPGGSQRGDDRFSAPGGGVRRNRAGADAGRAAGAPVAVRPGVAGGAEKPARAQAGSVPAGAGQAGALSGRPQRDRGGLRRAAAGRHPGAGSERRGRGGAFHRWLAGRYALSQPPVWDMKRITLAGASRKSCFSGFSSMAARMAASSSASLQPARSSGRSSKRCSWPRHR